MLDSLDMFGAASRLPEQVATAAELARKVPDLPSPEGVSSVVVFGMGGSGIGGDVLAALAGPSCGVPIVVSKGYECPAHVGPDTLVFASSFSGNTQETLAAATAAREAGARMVVLAEGGELARLAGEWGAPHLQIAPGLPMPRAGIAAVSVPLLVTLSRMGLCAEVDPSIEATIAQLERRIPTLRGDGSPAAELARRIGRTMPILYGDSTIGAVAAKRWKCQFNENPKVPAFANEIPELTHNEICGWAQHGDVTRQVFSAVLLRHDHEHELNRRRFTITAEISDEIVAGVHTVTAEGDGPMAQLFDLIVQGDFVTLELAVQSGVDPGPIPVLDGIKVAMSR